MRHGTTRLTMALILAAAIGVTGCDPDQVGSDLEDELEDVEDELEDVEDELDEREAAGRYRDREAIARLRDHLAALRAMGITGLLAELDLGPRRVLVRRGVARLDEPGRVPWNARFRTASVTKTFVAVVALQLVGEGVVSLDDTVESWLPGVVAGNGYDATQITVRHLLQHTSGIFNYTTAMLADWTPERYHELRFTRFEPGELVAIALQHPPDFAPGTAWSYSNTNYILAGMIIERATGRPWQDEVRDRIATPLGLRHTYDPGDDPDLEGPHAHGYDQFVEDGPLVDVTLQNHTFAGAAGSLVTTTRDLSRFLRALQRGRLLGEAEMEEMQRTVPATTLEPVMPGVRYGLGIMQLPATCGGVFWSHFGDTVGFSTRTAVSDDGDRAVVVSLSSNLAGGAQLEVLAENLELLDDAMCAGR